MTKQMVLKQLDEEDMIIETDFSKEELSDCIDSITDELIDTEEPWDDAKIISTLVEKGYIKIINPSIESIEI